MDDNTQTKPLATLTGTVSYILNDGREDGKLVFRIKEHGTGKQFLVSGHDLTIHRGVMYEFRGKKGTKSDQAFLADMAVPTDAEPGAKTVAWLVSVFSGSGMGAATARKVWEKFGDDTEKIIREDPMKLAEVKGISKAKAEKMKEKMDSSPGYDRLAASFLPYGVTPQQCSALYKEYGEEAYDIMTKNPYVLMKVCGTQWMETDAIGLAMGVDPLLPGRLSGASRKAFSDAYEAGSTVIPESQWTKWAVRALLSGQLPEGVRAPNYTEAVKKWLEEKIQAGSLIREVLNDREGNRDTYLCTAKQLAREQDIASIALKLAGTASPIKCTHEMVREKAAEFGLTLAPEQEDAIVGMLSSGFCIVTGGPGVGKTTIMTVAVSICAAKGIPSILLAPTGRAARKLAEATGMDAKTAHSFLGLMGGAPPKEPESVHDSLIIVDEASMLDTEVALAVLSCVGKGSMLCLVGDEGQLPSVGPGAILRDLIASKLFGTYRLTKIYRQDEGGPTCRNIWRVGRGETDLEKGEGFTLHREKEGDAASQSRLMCRLYTRRLKEYGIGNVALLLPYRKGDCGVNAMNLRLQELVNPLRRVAGEVKRGGISFRPGDPVMHTGGNSEEASNGDLGTVKSVSPSTGIVIVTMNGKDLEYQGDLLRGLELAYACTVHKSQGGEWPAVVTCISSLYPAMLERAVPYVAFSRAREELDVVCDSGLETAIRNPGADKRMTLLPKCLDTRAGRPVPRAV